MKKLAITLMFVGLAIAGCNSTEKESASETTASQVEAEEAVTAVTKEGLVQAKFPVGWYDNPDEHPYDLQYFSGDQRTNTGIFVYNRSDFASDMKAADVLNLQIEDLNSKRENFVVVEPENTAKFADKKITTATYSGDKDQSKFNYKFSVVEFTEYPDVLAIALQVTFPSEWEQKQPVLMEILESFEVIPPAPAEAESETPE
ncbi:MAG: hypothetical protein WBB82_02295 [Limnothrix sp.]